MKFRFFLFFVIAIGLGTGYVIGEMIPGDTHKVTSIVDNVKNFGLGKFFQVGFLANNADLPSEVSIAFEIEPLQVDGLQSIDSNPFFVNTIDQCIYHSPDSMDPICVICEIFDHDGTKIAEGSIIDLENQEFPDGYVGSTQLKIDLEPTFFNDGKPSNDVKTAGKVKVVECGEECRDVWAMFTELKHGSKLPAINSILGQDGITLEVIANSGGENTAIIFDADETGTPDPDLQVDNELHLLIIPKEGTTGDTSPNDGRVDTPNDSANGGTMIFRSDIPRFVVSFDFVDHDNNKLAEARFYKEKHGGMAFKTVPIPNKGDGSVQTIPVFAAGVQRIEIEYKDSGGITNLHLLCEDCKDVWQDFTDLKHGSRQDAINSILNPDGVTVSAEAFSGGENEVIIFDADETGTPDPDLQVDNELHLLIIPKEGTTGDTSPNDGRVDTPNDSANGGKMIFKFDIPRFVVSFDFVDHDNNKLAEARVYHEKNGGTAFKTVPIPNKGDGSVQTINVNAANVQRLEIIYKDSGGVTNLHVLCKPPKGGEGCTPGYWKQEHHFDSWPSPFKPSDRFYNIFERKLPQGKTTTLLQVLKFTGGVDNQLARHAVAALLNAQSSDVDYEFTPLEVITLFQVAFDSGNKDQKEAQKDAFEKANEEKCPLNGKKDDDKDDDHGNDKNDDYENDDYHNTKYDNSQIILQTNFDSDEDGFRYYDDPFKGTSEPRYADGKRLSSGGFSGGALQVIVGGKNNADIHGMSGGWGKTFTLTESKDITLSFRYKLTQNSNYESDELSQALVSVDGNLFGQQPNEYVNQIVGDGDGGSKQTTGWKLFEVNIGTLNPGDHNIIIGNFNNKKTYKNESTELLIDDVSVRVNYNGGDYLTDTQLLSYAEGQVETNGNYNVEKYKKCKGLSSLTVQYHGDYSPAAIKISNSKVGKLEFNNVKSGNDQITVEPLDGKKKLSKYTKFKIYNEDGKQKDTVRLKTSCKEPINIGDFEYGKKGRTAITVTDLEKIYD